MKAAKRNRGSERRGIVLLIVLAMLGLFAAVGVAFATFSSSAARGALDFRRTRQGYDGPAPRELLKGALDQLISDTMNPQSSMRGHSLLRDMYGGWDRAVRTGAAPNYVYSPSGFGAELRTNPDGSRRDYMGAFNGTGIFPPRKVENPVTGPNPNTGIGNGLLTQDELLQHVGRLFVPREFGILSSDPFANPAPNTKAYFPYLPYNYQIFDAIGARTATAPMGGNAGSTASGSGQMPTPELYACLEGGNWRYHWFPFDEDYDAADHNNWYLALERADGTVIVPSFHRPHLVRQMELANVFGPNPNTFPAYNMDTLTAPENETTPVVSGRRILFRPRRVDVDANTVLGNGLPANFPTLRDLNGNGIFGDMPEELDVDTDGDGKPDSIWIDLGTRPFRQEDGTLVKPLYAFKVVAMDGKVNANLAGNFVANPLAPTPQSQLGVEGRPDGHISAYGSSPAEVNPRHVMNLDQQNTAANPAYDPARGDYWPVWMQPNPSGTPAYFDPIYLRLLLNGLPPLTANTMPATAVTVNVPGRWTNPNAVTANFLLDRPGQRATDDDGSMPSAFNANIPNEPTIGTPVIVRNTVSSSLGPVGWQAGRRHPPFTKRAAALANPPFATAPSAGTANPTVGSVFPKFVNHVHGHFRDGRAYWPGYDATAIGFPPPYNPVMAPVLVSATNAGEFDYNAAAPSGSMNIFAPTYPFDLTTFGLPGTVGFALPNLASNWQTTAGTIAYNHASFPAFVQSMQILMTTDDANEINPYSTTSAFNSPFTNSQIEQMLRFSDIDGSTLDDRTLRLLTFNVGAESKQVIGNPYQYNAVQAARERQRRMWTAESWDLINFSNPPVYGDPLNIPGAASYAPAATLMESRNPPTPNDAALYTSPAGTANPPYGVNAPAIANVFQHNGYLWRPANTVAGYAPEAPLGFAFFTQTITPPTSVRASAQPVLGNELAGRFPVEVLRGRRYDLNRPLTSYESRADLADAERTAMAQQIYTLLWLSAGVNMRPNPANVDEMREALAQARTLAQLAVNIVDYIDPDNVMTEMRFHPFLNSANVITEWNNIETMAAGAGCMFTMGTQTLANVRTEELTVLGFEMPDLVISEGVSVTETGATAGTELTMVWAELFNPWPNETDLDSGASTVAPPTPRGRLFDETPLPVIPGGRTMAQSRFILGVRQNNATAGSRDPAAPALGGDFHGNTQRYVHFAGTGLTGVTNPDGTFTTPRNTANNGPDIRGGQRLLVEPNPAMTDPGSLIQDWTPASGPNRFTCTAPSMAEEADLTGINDMRIVRTEVNPGDDNDANVVLSLYRLRNPYRDWNADTNPYVAIDTLELRGDLDNQVVEARGAYDLTKSTPPPITDRRSMERKQPWHGSNRPWMPYRGTTGNQMATLVDTATTPARFLEGKFLGFPYLTADATTAGPVNPTMTSQPWGNQLFADGFDRSTNGARGNTLYGTGETTATQYATNHTDTQNTLDAALTTNNSRYISFPFLNRQLASPLELLSVRLYGSHPWAVPGAGGTNDREWRLRFTDDFEFQQDVANNQIAPNYPALPGGGFNRIYRSREVPWYLNDRKLHPIDLAPNFLYDPAATTGATASGNRLAPFPNLYRFFEMVETRSRVNGAGGWATLAASTAAGGTADLRQSRVPGKINLNPLADEEPLKALFDDEAVMPFTPVGAVKTPIAPGMPAAPGATSDRYRPINYPVDLVDPGYTGGVARLVKALGWNPGTGASELSVSGHVEGMANRSFVVSSNASMAEQPIDFGGTLTTATGNYDTQSVDLGTLPATSTRRLVHSQFPGIINGPLGYRLTGGVYTGLYPGWDRDVQVGSEFFRMLVFSRGGRDALWGTADDKPFRSFASGHVSDTMLRKRNYALLDQPNDARWGSTASPATQGSFLAAVGQDGAPGEYITRLGGQWTPRLFDPVPMPYSLDGNPATPATIVPANTQTMAHRADVAQFPGSTTAPPAVEYWTQEWRRNELIAKTASNVTARSNVFGVWVTVGFFRVEPGTENLLVPLLHEEVGSSTGTQRRHRMFAIIDRTRATEFTELMTISPPKIEDNAVVRHYSFIE